MSRNVSLFRQIISSIFKEGDEETKESFIYFWDDVYEDEYSQITKEERKSIFEILRSNQLLLGSLFSLMLAPLTLFFYSIGNATLAIISTILLVFTILINHILNNNRYQKNLELLASKSERFSELNFSIGDEFIFGVSDDPAVQNLNEFRSKMAASVNSLNRTVRDINFQLTTIENRFSRTASSLGLANSSFDQSIANIRAYQEFKGHITHSSSGIDRFTSTFDDAIQLINDSVKLLRSLGKQTQMYALNAGIEASRSGEFGVGFEVVASNLQRLSSHIMNSASNFKEQITDISKNAKDSLEQITSSMQQAQGNLDQSHNILTSIQSDVNRSSREFNSVQSNYDDLFNSIKSIENEMRKFTT